MLYPQSRNLHIHSGEHVAYPEAVSLLQRTGRGSQAAGRRPEPHPADEAAAVGAPATWSTSTSFPQTSYIHSNGALRFGAMTRHAEIAASADVARIPILHDCAAGIADPQVRNMGTIGGSIAEADPTGDWAPVLLATGATVHTLGPSGERNIDIGRLHSRCLYDRAASQREVVTEIAVPLNRSAAAAPTSRLKRCAPVYASASVAVQLTHARCADLQRRAHLPWRAWPYGDASHRGGRSAARTDNHAAKHCSCRRGGDGHRASPIATCAARPNTSGTPPAR